MTLWRALLEGVGWRVGKEIAEDAIRTVTGASEDRPPEDPAVTARRLEAQAREAAKALERERAERARRAKQQAKDVERELAALKKQVAREKK